MKLTSPILISKFAEHLAVTRPHLTKQQIKEICTSEFEHVKDKMSSGKLPVIRLKYLGTFLARPGRVRAIKDNLKKRFDKGNMSQQDYFTMRDNLENYAENYKKES